MQAREVRSTYLNYFKARKHSIIPRASLVPQDDPTTLFTGSGMQQLLPYLLGAKHPDGTRLVDSQTCLRAEDIEEVGDNRHTTFFEMLGNWSLGDYFKADQLTWFWDFLIDEVGLDPNKLYVTCFIGDKDNNIPKDNESAKIWTSLFKKSGLMVGARDVGSNKIGYDKGIKNNERIFFYGATKNWWSRSGEPKNMPPGEPGGPDSEVFYRFNEDHDTSYGKYCHPNCDCGAFLEIGNSVFMEYLATEKGFVTLPNKNVDFGGGLERIAAAKQNEPDIFKISIIWPIIEKLIEISSKAYEDHIEAKRVIADHLRAAVWLAVDGVSPSNKEHGYVLRRLIRRAVLKAHELDIDSKMCEKVAPVVVELYKDDYSEMAERGEQAVQSLAKEEALFRQTLKKGVRLFKKEVKDSLDGKNIFKLYDTYGFPTELSLEQAKNLQLKVHKNWQKDFDEAMQVQKDRSRTATKGQFSGGLGGQSDLHKKYHTATHLIYKALKMVLGDHVLQRGSNITSERLRFDFEHPQKMTDDEKAAVEKIVNDQIKNGLKVTFDEISAKEALDKGALGAFGDKYGEKVKVYTMSNGEEKFSFEICGGPHVENTSELSEDGKTFKIIKEKSSSAGVRRIKAVLE